MPDQPPSLRASTIVLRVLTILNLFFGLVFVLLVAATLVAPQSMAETWTGNPDLEAAGLTIAAFRWVLVIAILCTIPAHLLLSRLSAIVASVRDGNAFAWDNARRLKAIAWLLLVLQLLDLCFGVVDHLLSPATIGFDWSPSLTGWLAVLLLFVLARVFEEGARMRDDLEGTV